MDDSAKVIPQDHILYSVGNIFVDFDAVLAGTPPPYDHIGNAFKKNIDAAIVTSSLPYDLTLQAVVSRRAQFLFAAHALREKGEAIRQSKDIDAHEVHRIAQEKTRVMLDEEISSDEGSKRMLEEIDSDLKMLLSKESVKSACAEVLRQAIVLLWGTLEVFCTDVFVTHLNCNPHRASLLSRNETTKKWFSVRDSFKLFDEHGYDLSEQMGDVLVVLHRIDDVDTIRATFGTLFGSARLNGLLLDDHLWKLNQRRNLIVHRRGIVDDVYRDNTGEDIPVGNQLIISPSQLTDSFSFVVNVGSELLRAASASS